MINALPMTPAARRATLLAAVIAFAGCATAQAPQPAEVYRAYCEAINAGRAEAAAATFAPDATMVGGSFCPTDNPCRGRDDIRKRYIEPAIARQMQYTSLGEARMDGGKLVSDIEVRFDATRKAGIERIVGRNVIEMQGGLIQTKAFALDGNDAQTQAFLEWRKAQAAAAR